MSGPGCDCPFENKRPPGPWRILAALAALALFLALLTWIGQ